MAIESFADKGSEDIHAGVNSKEARATLPKNLWPVARRKLLMLDQAYTLPDLRTPPANRLEKLTGEWAGYHSIRINQQYRVVFRWLGRGTHEVLVVDYH